MTEMDHFNPDCMDVTELRAWLAAPADARRSLVVYIKGKVAAMECRAAGRIAEALNLEALLERQYKLLNEADKW